MYVQVHGDGRNRLLPETVEVRYRQREEIDFDGVSIDGTLVGPEVELIGERARGRFNPLITLRTSFASEMVGSLDAVK
jgi:hypothetical protein